MVEGNINYFLLGAKTIILLFGGWRDDVSKNSQIYFF